MKRSKQVALWLTGSLAVSGCNQSGPGGNQTALSGTNGSQSGYSGSGWHGGGWHWSSGGFSGEDEGVSRGGFGGHGGEGFGE